MSKIWIVLLLGVPAGCGGGLKEDLQFKDIRNIKYSEKESVIRLTGDAVLYNPNKVSLSLREVELKVFMNEKEAAVIKQKMDVKVKARSEFTIPVQAQLTLSEGLMDTLLNILGQKSNTLKLVGFVKIKVHGVGVKIPVSHTEELRL